jgi:hypothetical protein
VRTALDEETTDPGSLCRLEDVAATVPTNAVVVLVHRLQPAWVQRRGEARKFVDNDVRADGLHDAGHRGTVEDVTHMGLCPEVGDASKRVLRAADDGHGVSVAEELRHEHAPYRSRPTGDQYLHEPPPFSP